MPFGKPASLQRSRNQLLKTATENGLPKLVVKNVGFRLTTLEGGMATSAEQKSGWSGIVTQRSLGPVPFFAARKVMVRSPTWCGQVLTTLPRRAAVASRMLDGEVAPCP